jgi:hypothetical protein
VILTIRLKTENSNEVLMPICPKCRTGYDEPVENCPKCGAAKPEKVIPEVAYHTSNNADYRCGGFAFFCLHFARVAAFLGVVLSLVGVAASVGKGEWMQSLGLLFVAFPLAYGHYVAFSMAVKYACRE